MPMPPSTYAMRKHKTRISTGAINAKQTFAQNLKQQKRDYFLYLLQRAKIAPHSIDFWIKFLETVKNKSIERDERTRMGKFIKVIEKSKDLAEQASKNKKYFAELRKPAHDVIVQANFKHAFDVDDFTSIAMVVIIFLKIAKKILKK